MSYTGERIDPTGFVAAVEEAARSKGFTLELLTRVGPHPVLCMEKVPDGPCSLRVYLSAGVHGDEPAAPLAILHLLKSGALDQYQNVHWVISPMLNPTGFEQNTRENARGIDLNRDFHGADSPEIQALKKKMDNIEKCDLAIMLHEDWEASGFYFYDLSSNPSRTPGKAMIDAVSSLGPVDHSEMIDEMPAEEGIIYIDVEEAPNDPKLEGNWPEAFYVHELGLADYQYTIEAPSALSLSLRTDMLVAATCAAVESVLSLKKGG
jgi:protein MpaA